MRVVVNTERHDTERHLCCRCLFHNYQPEWCAARQHSPLYFAQQNTFHLFSFHMLAACCNRIFCSSLFLLSSQLALSITTPPLSHIRTLFHLPLHTLTHTLTHSLSFPFSLSPRKLLPLDLTTPGATTVFPEALGNLTDGSMVLASVSSGTIVIASACLQSQNTIGAYIFIHLCMCMCVYVCICSLRGFYVGMCPYIC